MSVTAGVEEMGSAPASHASDPAHDQTDGVGRRKALLFALQNRVADIVSHIAMGPATIPPLATSPAVAVTRSMSSPSVCSFSSTLGKNRSPIRFGVEAVDRRLPAEGFAAQSVNEFKSASVKDAATTLTLMLTLAARSPPGPVLLVVSGRAGIEHGLPYGPGIDDLGLCPQRLLVAQAPRLADALWTIEEGLRSGALAAVAGLLDTRGQAIGIVPARRLVLAADEGQTPCLLMTGSESPGVNVAHSRWRVAARPSAPHPFDPSAPGARRCRLELERCRHGPSGLGWLIEWDEDGRLLETMEEVPRLTKQSAQRGTP